MKENILTKKQIKGIKEIKRKVKETAVVFKTGQLSIDDKENYKECMKEHVIDDEIVSMKEYEEDKVTECP